MTPPAHGGARKRFAFAADALAPSVLEVFPGALCVAPVMPSPSWRETWPGLPEGCDRAGAPMAAGRGVTAEAARTSAVGEWIEHVSSFDWGDAPVTMARIDALEGPCVAPAALAGLSAAQRAAREDWNRAWSALDRHPRLPAEDETLAWLAMTDAASGARVMLPADAVLRERAGSEPDDLPVTADSTGLAAGQSPADADARAIAELIERDALGRWWYGRRARPALQWWRLADLLPEAEGLVAFLRARERRTRVLDITTDIGFLAVVAVSAEAEGGAVLMGHAAGTDPAATVLAALTEMLQEEIALSVALGTGRQSDLDRYWLAEAHAGIPPIALAGAEDEARPIERAGDGGTVSAEERRSRLVAALAAAGVPVFLRDLTRPEIGVPVSRAIAPALCSARPRFGRARLLAADARDLLGTAAPEDGPNPVFLAR